MDAETDHEARDREQGPGSNTAPGSAQVEAEHAPVEAQGEDEQCRYPSGEPRG